MLVVLLIGALTWSVEGVRPTVSNDDHLLQVLLNMHHSQSFKQLPTSEKVILTELLAAAEVDQITHYIDGVGFDRILTFIDHVNSISQPEAHLLEKYLVQELQQEETSSKRDLQGALHQLTTDAAYQNLSASDQAFLKQLVTAAETNTVTPFIEQHGYASVISVIEHITAPRETHVVLHYLTQHIANEAHHHGHNPQPVG